MAKIVDLDALVGADIVVKIDSEEYPVPADCPAELFLRILHFSDEAQGGDGKEDASEYEATKALRDAVLELFQIRRPELERLPGNLGLSTLVMSIGQIYGAGEESERPTSAPEQGEDNGEQAGTKKQTRSSRSSKSKQTASRSSRS